MEDEQVKKRWIVESVGALIFVRSSSSLKEVANSASREGGAETVKRKMRRGGSMQFDSQRFFRTFVR